MTTPRNIPGYKEQPQDELLQQLLADGVPYNMAAKVSTVAGGQLDEGGLYFIEALILNELRGGQQVNIPYMVNYAQSTGGQAALGAAYHNFLLHSADPSSVEQAWPELQDVYGQAYSRAMWEGGEALPGQQAEAWNRASAANEMTTRREYDSYSKAGGELDYTDWFNERAYQQYKGRQGYLAEQVPMKADPERYGDKYASRGITGAGVYGGMAVGDPGKLFTPPGTPLTYETYQKTLGGMTEGQEAYFGPRYSSVSAEIGKGRVMDWDAYLEKYLGEKYKQLSPRARGEYGNRLAPRTRVLNY